MKNAYILSALILVGAFSSYSQDRAHLSVRSYLIRDSLVQRISWKPFNAPTLGVQVLTSVGVGGIVIGSTIAIARKNYQGGTDNILAALINTQNIVYFLGCALGAGVVPLSVYYSGQWMGGNGEQTWTLLGALGGSGVGILLIALPGSMPGEEILTYVAAMGIAGAILGYHFSSSTVYASAERNSMSALPKLVNKQALSGVYLPLVQISINF